MHQPHPPSREPRLQVDATQLDWTPTEHTGVERKLLASDVPAGQTIALVRLAPGASLPVPAGHTSEVLVLEGSWTLAAGTFTPGGYVVRPPDRTGDDSTREGCVLFVRSAPGAVEALHLAAEESAWLPGQGNLRVRPLHSAGTVNTALVHWPAGERFVPHRHFSGEEILVLSGVFEDEHGRYPAGTWLSSPHLSEHHPFVAEETVIYVKTGHRPPASHQSLNPRLAP